MRKRSWMIATSSLVTVMALLVAPICAPLCAAHSCSPSSGGAAASSDCHLAMLSQQDALRIHSLQNCGASELPVAALLSTSRSKAFQSSTMQACATDVLTIPHRIASSLILHRWSCHAGNESLRNSDPLHTTSVLRI
jgi:hypothetical protein